MKKYRRLFCRSEYQIALHNYRKARRRGDAADAQRWIRIAEMHLRVVDRFDEGVRATRVRETAIARTREIEPAYHEKKDPFAQRRLLDDIQARMMADIAADFANRAPKGKK